MEDFDGVGGQGPAAGGANNEFTAGGGEFVGVIHFRLGLGSGSSSRSVYDRRVGLTEYCPVGLSLFPSLLWEVSIERNLGQGDPLNIY